MLKKNQQRLKEKRRAKRMAESKKKKESSTPKPQSQQSRATSVAFSGKNNFGAMLKDKPKAESPQRPPQGSQDGPKDPPKPPRTPRPETHSPVTRTPTTPYRSRAQGLRNVQQGTGGASGGGKPKRKDFNSDKAFQTAMTAWTMRQKMKGQVDKAKADSGRPSWVSPEKWKWLNK